MRLTRRIPLVLAASLAVAAVGCQTTATGPTAPQMLDQAVPVPQPGMRAVEAATPGMKVPGGEYAEVTYIAEGAITRGNLSVAPSITMIYGPNQTVEKELRFSSGQPNASWGYVLKSGVVFR